MQVANADARGRLVLLEKSRAAVLTLNVKTGKFRRWATLPDLPTCSSGVDAVLAERRRRAGDPELRDVGAARGAVRHRLRAGGDLEDPAPHAAAAGVVRVRAARRDRVRDDRHRLPARAARPADHPAVDRAGRLGAGRTASSTGCRSRASGRPGHPADAVDVAARRPARRLRDRAVRADLRRQRRPLAADRGAVGVRARSSAVPGPARARATTARRSRSTPPPARRSSARGSWWRTSPSPATPPTTRSSTCTSASAAGRRTCRRRRTGAEVVGVSCPFVGVATGTNVRDPRLTG